MNSILDKLLDVSIDRITIVGYPVERDLVRFHMWLANQIYSQQIVTNDFNYKYSYVLHNDLGFVQISDGKSKVSPIRYEFNPKHMKDNKQLMAVCLEILSWIVDKKLNRVDVAIDLNLDLRDYKIYDAKQRQSVEYYARKKILETYYVGSRQSDLHFRFYNKQTEHNKKEMDKQKQYEKEGEEYEPQLINFDWWRFEVEMKGDDARSFVDKPKRNPFEDISIYMDGEVDTSGLDYEEESTVLRLLENRSDLDRIPSRRKREKYKKILSELEFKNREEIDLAYIFEQKKSELRSQLNSLINQYIKS